MRIMLFALALALVTGHSLIGEAQVETTSQVAALPAQPPVTIQMTDAQVAAVAAATPGAPAPVEDLTSIIRGIAQAGHARDWRMVIALFLVGCGLVIRRYASPFIPWLQTDRGGVVMALGLGAISAVTVPLLAAQAITAWVIVDALFMWITTAGTYSLLKKLIYPSVTKTNSVAKLAMLLPLLFIGLTACTPSQWTTIYNADATVNTIAAAGQKGWTAADKIKDTAIADAAVAAQLPQAQAQAQAQLAAWRATAAKVDAAFGILNDALAGVKGGIDAAYAQYQVLQAQGSLTVFTFDWVKLLPPVFKAACVVEDALKLANTNVPSLATTLIVVGQLIGVPACASLQPVSLILPAEPWRPRSMGPWVRLYRGAL